jgi:hypothetical protein
LITTKMRAKDYKITRLPQIENSNKILMNPNPLQDVVEDALLTLPPDPYLSTVSMKLVKVEFPINNPRP